MIKLIYKMLNDNSYCFRLEKFSSNCLAILIAFSLFCWINPFGISLNFADYIPKVKGDYPVNWLLFAFLIYRFHFIRQLCCEGIDFVSDKLKSNRIWSILQSCFEIILIVLVVILFILCGASFVQLARYSIWEKNKIDGCTLLGMIMNVICFLFEQAHKRYCFYTRTNE